jgi:undecaprenyl-diphosphatase
MRDISALGGVTVITLVTIVAALVFLFHRKWLQAALFLGATLTAEIAAQVLKTVYNRPRPDLAPHGAYVHSASFPSGHTMTSTAVYLMMAVLISTLEHRRPTKVLAFTVAIFLMACIGASRVYLAVHWPSDVLAGWAAGSGVVFIAWSLLLRLHKGRDRPRPTN